MKPDLNIAWAALLLAGLFEVGFTTAMTLSQRGQRWGDVMFIACIAASFSLLHFATKTIPLGIAYAIWTGIGAAGTLAVSTLVFKSPINAVQIALVLVLIGAVIGLKLAHAN